MTQVGPAAELYVNEEGDKPLSIGATFISPTLLLADSYFADPKYRKWLAKEAEESPLVLKIRPLGADLTLPAKLVWHRFESDGHRDTAALIEVDSSLLDPGTQIRYALMGRLVGAGARACEVIGSSTDSFTHANVMLRLTGRVDPGTYPESDIRYLKVADMPPGRPSGFMGAGILVAGHLIGIISGIYSDTGTFSVLPLSSLVADQSFRQVLESRIGHVPPLASLPSSDAELVDAISQADPSNIQQVAATQLALSNRYYENVLSQAKRSFNAAVVAAVVGLAFFLAAVLFSIISRQLAGPLVSLIGGTVVEVVAGLNFWLYARTAIQLNAFHLRLERMQRFLVANSVAASLTGDNRESALAELVKVISIVSPPELSSTDEQGQP